MLTTLYNAAMSKSFGAANDARELRVDVASIGARRQYSLPLQLHRAGVLRRFYTDVYMGNKPVLRRVLSHLPRKLQPEGLRRLLGRTSLLPRDHVRSFDLYGLQLYLPGTRDNEYWVRQSRRFCELVRPCIAGCDAVLARSEIALEIFEEARRLGIATVLEQSAAPVSVYTALNRQERERWPGWESGSLAAQSPNMEEREREEWALADCILCPSTYVKSLLVAEGVPEGKLAVLPYGFKRPRDGEAEPRKPHEKLRVVVVGAVRLMKGTQYLLEALRMLGPDSGIECRAVGEILIDSERLKPYQDLVEMPGAVPFREVWEHFRWADVFLLPTLSDSFAMVQLEAMSQGLPVIVTTEAGDVVREGTDGFVIPPRDPEAIAAALVKLRDDRSLLQAMSKAALERSSEFSITRYGDQLVETIRSVVERRA